MTGETAQGKWIFKTVGGVKFLKLFIMVLMFVHLTMIQTLLQS
jgi:hypothetical protein